jgi:hypothetical protein
VYFEQGKPVNQPNRGGHGQNNGFEDLRMDCRYPEVIQLGIVEIEQWLTKRYHPRVQLPKTKFRLKQELAKQRRYAIVHEYTDTISGAKSKRPGLDQRLAGAQRHRFDVVLVAAFDGVARNVRHLLEVLERVGRVRLRQAVNTLSICFPDIPTSLSVRS